MLFSEWHYHFSEPRLGRVDELPVFLHLMVILLMFLQVNLMQIARKRASTATLIKIRRILFVALQEKGL